MRVIETNRPIEILLVDDNPADAYLVEDAVREAKIRNRLTWLQDGAEALEYLACTGSHANATRPDLVLLDMNLPRVDGREILQRLMGDPSLCTIATVVMTGSASDESYLRSTGVDAPVFIIKPLTVDKLFTILQQFDQLHRLLGSGLGQGSDSRRIG